MYFDQLLVAAHQVHVVYFGQLLGAAHYLHFIFNHDNFFKVGRLEFWFIFCFSTLNLSLIVWDRPWQNLIKDPLRSPCSLVSKVNPKTLIVCLDVRSTLPVFNVSGVVSLFKEKIGQVITLTFRDYKSPNHQVGQHFLKKNI